MPWIPHYTEEEARAAITGAESWAEVLERFAYAYHGKNIATVRRWADRWGIPVDHLPDARGNRRPLRYTDDELRWAIAKSRSWAEALRRLGYCPSGGNWKTLKTRTAALGVSIEHFDPYARSRERSRRDRTPLEKILVEGSDYSRSTLKRRLYDAGLKHPQCELCGQDELWRGKRMGLILDHANGIRDDNRLENLRIVCPNCAATLDTHCGRKNHQPRTPRECVRCGQSFLPRYETHRYCSRECGSRWNRRGVKRPGARKAERPPVQQLLTEVSDSATSLSAGSTASPTTQSASGCAITACRRSQCEPGRAGAGRMNSRRRSTAR